MERSFFSLIKVSKGINFRDGHSCNARCAPSRYCLLTGRHHFRRGNYNYKAMSIEHGRKILPHLFKRNNYETLLIGKDQPLGSQWATTNKDKTDHYHIAGQQFHAFDRSFVSRNESIAFFLS